MCIAITEYHTKCSRKNYKDSPNFFFFCFQHHNIAGKRKIRNIYDDFYIVDYLCQDETILMPGTVFFNSEYTENVKIKYAISPDAPRRIIICKLSISDFIVGRIDEIFIKFFLVHIIAWIVQELTQAELQIPLALRPGSGRAKHCRTCRQSPTPCTPCSQGKFCKSCAQSNQGVPVTTTHSTDEEELSKEWFFMDHEQQNN